MQILALLAYLYHYHKSRLCKQNISCKEFAKSSHDEMSTLGVYKNIRQSVNNILMYIRDCLVTPNTEIISFNLDTLSFVYINFSLDIFNNGSNLSSYSTIHDNILMLYISILHSYHLLAYVDKFKKCDVPKCYLSDTEYKNILNLPVTIGEISDNLQKPLFDEPTDIFLDLSWKIICNGEDLTIHKIRHGHNITNKFAVFRIPNKAMGKIATFKGIKEHIFPDHAGKYNIFQDFSQFTIRRQGYADQFYFEFTKSARVNMNYLFRWFLRGKFKSSVSIHLLDKSILKKKEIFICMFEGHINVFKGVKGGDYSLKVFTCASDIFFKDFNRFIAKNGFEEIIGVSLQFICDILERTYNANIMLLESHMHVWYALNGDLQKYNDVISSVLSGLLA